MKKLMLFVLLLSLILVGGCRNKKDMYLPEVKNDKTYTTIGTMFSN